MRFQEKKEKKKKKKTSRFDLFDLEKSFWETISSPMGKITRGTDNIGVAEGTYTRTRIDSKTGASTVERDVRPGGRGGGWTAGRYGRMVLI